ncbi:23S rRNA (cytidine(2498)-2'-O)-methyltransferase RlmM [Parendozoicomonas sp. Alg238-R29]|uniref:23S rRNA (cytidine(2498)-2'-O)-methyltransferase RlmM n=1 Tax=Parendozoicomonas sp. Alg238-R29 TaxID=2993446 RepID=UPI00248F3E22|nr:23S rRNA (cytidine(2498)-2'-O)-methyltransferase RlmM [Parendozoicomonas sp. Alg238-R29]
MSRNHLLLYCRPGFESDMAGEIQDKAAVAGIYGYVKTKKDSGYVVYITQEPDGAWKLMGNLRFDDLVFARQWCAAVPMLENISQTDRVSAILEALNEHDFPCCGDVVLETADTNEAKELSGFCKKFVNPLRQSLRKADKLTSKPNEKISRLHCFFLDSTNVYVGITDTRNSSPWSGGILRLKFPKAAPSRSTLKLEEAFHTFIPADDRDTRLAPGMKSVDLGAAPGGWTWQLVNRSMMVIAVDNGPMQQELLDTAQVDHREEDAFTFQPPKQVDWMVCDIVDKPSRSAELMARWLVNGWCRETIFNLKLPMKQRWQAVQSALQMVEDICAGQGVQVELRCKQLFHDREEVTVHGISV